MCNALRRTYFSVEKESDIRQNRYFTLKPLPVVGNSRTIMMNPRKYLVSFTILCLQDFFRYQFKKDALLTSVSFHLLRQGFQLSIELNFLRQYL